MIGSGCSPSSPSVSPMSRSGPSPRARTGSGSWRSSARARRSGQHTMGKFTGTHEINCGVDTFWKTFFDKDFNVELYKTALGFPDWQILEQTETETQVTRKVSGQPKMEVPGPVQKLIGSGFRYTEEGSMTRSEGIWRWK